MQVHASKDVQIAIDVGKKAALGWMDVEFTAYGCAWLDKKQNKIYYKVSSKAEDIYEFIERGAQQGIYPSNIMRYSEKCPVPAGAKNLIAQAVKTNLAKRLQQAYPKAFFETLYQLAEICTDNTANEMLWQIADELEGRFEEEQLKHFSVLVDYAYSCCRLDKEHYHKLVDWIIEERSSMADSYTEKDIYEKTMYGIAYIENGVLKHTENALKSWIYEKIYDLEQHANNTVTPILSYTYWHNHTYRLPQIIQDFRKKLENEYDQVYMDRIIQLRAYTGTISFDETKKTIEKVNNLYGSPAADTLGCVKKSL